VRNEGGAGKTAGDNKLVSGSFTVVGQVSPPIDQDPDDGLHWELQPVLAAQVALTVTWTAWLVITTTGADTFAKAFVSLGSNLPAFNPSSFYIGAASGIPNTLLRTLSVADVFPTGDKGIVSYGGSVTIETKAGLPSESGHHVFARSALSFSAAISNTQVDATYALVPEPETYALMLGGLTLLGWRLRRVRNILRHNNTSYTRKIHFGGFLLPALPQQFTKTWLK
jgi:hypothetical protein